MFKYIVICPLVFLAGFIDAIAGGGGLISLPAYIMTGIPIHSCIATNKLSSSMGTSIATAKYAKSGMVPWKIALAAIPCALLGSATGANIALLIADDKFTIIMMVIIPLTAAYVLLKKDLAPSGEERPFKQTILISAVIAFVIGVYDGFYGPGTGTFLILLLTGIAHMQLAKANGLTKVINLSTNIAALVVYLINGDTLIVLGLTAGLFNIAGNYLGARTFEKGGSKIARPVIILVLVIFMIKMIR